MSKLIDMHEECKQKAIIIEQMIVELNNIKNLIKIWTKSPLDKRVLHYEGYELEKDLKAQKNAIMIAKLDYLESLNKICAYEF